MIIHVTDIEWDVDKNDKPEEYLPTKVNLNYDAGSLDFRGPFNEYLYDSICEDLENTYGYCVVNFAIDV